MEGYFSMSVIDAMFCEISINLMQGKMKSHTPYINFSGKCWIQFGHLLQVSIVPFTIRFKSAKKKMHLKMSSAEVVCCK